MQIEFDPEINTKNIFEPDPELIQELVEFKDNFSKYQTNIANHIQEIETMKPGAKKFIMQSMNLVNKTANLYFFFGKFHNKLKRQYDNAIAELTQAKGDYIETSNLLKETEDKLNQLQTKNNRLTKRLERGEALLKIIKEEYNIPGQQMSPKMIEAISRINLEDEE